MERGRVGAAGADVDRGERAGAGGLSVERGGRAGAAGVDVDRGGRADVGAGGLERGATSGAESGGGRHSNEPVGAGASGAERGAGLAGAEAAVASGGRGRGTGAAALDGVLAARGASGANTGTAEMERAAVARPRSPAASVSGGIAGDSATEAAAVPGRLTIRAVVEREPIEEEAPPPRSFLPWAAAGVAIVAVGWGAIHLLRSHSSANPVATNAASPYASPSLTQGDALTKPAPASQGGPPSAAQKPQAVPQKSEQRSRHHAAASNSTSNGSSTTDASAGVVHEEIPNVPHSALATIHGHVKVAVRVTVDSSGNVVSDTLDHAGPSQYFARVASQAARRWKFAPTDQKASRQWLVHFDFSRGGTAAHATGARS